MNLTITPLKQNQIEPLTLLAKEIWTEHYVPIIGEEQVNYMLEKFQSPSAIKNQLTEGYRYYLVNLNNISVGYFSIQLRNNHSLFISKFYLEKKARGQGIAKAMLQEIDNIATQSKCKSLDLTVNKFNPAYEVYIKLGFKKVSSAIFDIGNGYIMDDFVMSKEL